MATKKELLDIIESFLTSQCTGKRKRKTDGKVVYCLHVEQDVIRNARAALGLKLTQKKNLIILHKI